MKLSLYAIGAILAATVAAVPRSAHVLHEKREVQHKRWVKRDQLEGHVRVPVRIGMTQRNLHRAEELLMEVSAHDSPRYGEHYTEEEVIELFAPAKAAVDSIREWLVAEGIAANRIFQSANKQWLGFEGDVSEAERLFKAKYHVYEHVHSGVKHVACDEYHVPQHIKRHIDFVTPGLKLVNTRTKTRRNSETGHLEKRLSGPVRGPNITLPAGVLDKQTQLSMCDSQVGPACIQAMYNITPGTMNHKGNSLGIFEEGDYYAKEDLVLFFTTFPTPEIPVGTEPYNRGIDGGIPAGIVNIPIATGESNLDLQISYPIIHPQNSLLFQTDDPAIALGVSQNAGSGFLNTFLDGIDGSYCNFSAFGETGNAAIDPQYPDPTGGYLGPLQCGVWKAPSVVSISYGEQEDDLPTNYQRRQCLEFMKLGLKGTTVVLASGDSGVAARSSDAGNADGCLGTGSAAGLVFNPDFPASCPYVTALGATFLPTGADYSKDEEIAVTRFPSGGGFSNIYPAPSYQKATLANYFKNHDPGYPYYSVKYNNAPNVSITGKGIYNRIGRGYPDFGAIGDNVIIFLDGTPQLIGGTSASAPTFAAIISRINAERLHAGKSKVGFVNPVLYAHPEVMHDITNGTNAGCKTNGFSCVPGWDPVTGLGTPNYPAMLSLFLSLK